MLLVNLSLVSVLIDTPLQVYTVSNTALEPLFL